MTNSDLRFSRRLVISLALLFVTSLDFSRANPDLANGLGEHIDWVEWPEALSKAKELNKPVMVKLKIVMARIKKTKTL